MGLLAQLQFKLRVHQLAHDRLQAFRHDQLGAELAIVTGVALDDQEGVDLFPCGVSILVGAQVYGQTILQTAGRSAQERSIMRVSS